MTTAPDWATMLRMSSGVIVWALHFTLIYGFTALACARGLGASAPWAVAVATLIASVAAIAVIIANADHEFTRWLSASLAAAALLAILWEGLSALMVPDACA